MPIKTPTIEQIYRHYSVRRYKPDPISDEIIMSVVEAGQRASTSSNLQTYSVIVVKEAAETPKIDGLMRQSKTYRPGACLHGLVRRPEPAGTRLRGARI